MDRRKKIRPGMVFRVVEWNERFEITSVDGNEVVAKYYPDTTVTVISLWELLRDLADGELVEVPPDMSSPDGRSRRQRRQDAAEERRLLEHIRQSDAADRRKGAL